MTYDELLAAQPSPALHGNLSAAQEFVAHVTTAIHDKTQHWTPAQRVYLYRLYHKWWRRAQGQDLKWNLMAPRPGRPATHRIRRVRRVASDKRQDADMQDPLLQRIVAKYGHIRRVE